MPVEPIDTKLGETIGKFGWKRGIEVAEYRSVGSQPFQVSDSPSRSGSSAQPVTSSSNPIPASWHAYDAGRICSRVDAATVDKGHSRGTARHRGSLSVSIS